MTKPWETDWSKAPGGKKPWEKDWTGGKTMTPGTPGAAEIIMADPLKRASLPDVTYTDEQEDVIKAYVDRLLSQRDISDVKITDTSNDAGGEEQLDYVTRLQAERQAYRSGYKPPEKSSWARAAALGASQGATFYLGDEIAGGLNAAYEAFGDPIKATAFALVPARRKAVADRYRDTVETFDAMEHEARRDYPVTTVAGEVGAALPALFATGGAAGTITGSQVASRLPMAGRAKSAADATARAAQSVMNSLPGAKTAGTVFGNIAGNPVVQMAGKALYDPIKTIAKGATAGSVYGGAAGAGSARGGAEERASGAAAGAGMGAVAGGALAPAARYGPGAIGGFLQEMLGRTPEEKGMAATIRAMRRDKATTPDILDKVFELQGSPGMRRVVAEARQQGLTDQQIIARVRDAAARGGQRVQDTVEETLAELAGPRTSSLARAVANVGAEGGEAAQAVQRRGQTLSDSLETSMSRALRTDADDFYTGRARAQQNRSAGLQKRYDAVYANPTPEDAFFRAFFDAPSGARNQTPLGFRPRFQNVVEKVSRALREDGRTDLADEMDGFLGSVRKGNRPNRALSVEAIDEIDREVGDTIQRAIKPGGDGNNAARPYREIQEALRVIDEPTGLGAVRAQAKTQIDASKAADEGREAWKRGVDPEEIRETLDGASDEVFEQYMLGVVRGMSDQLRNQPNFGGLADASRKLAGTERMREKLATILPRKKNGKLTAQSQRFMDRLNRTRDMSEFASRTFGGSRTAPLSADIGEAARDTSLVTEALDTFANAQPINLLANMFGNLARGGTGIYNDDINRAIGSRVFASGRDGILGTLEDLSAYAPRVRGRINEGPERAVRRGAGLFGGSMAAREDPGAQDYDQVFAENGQEASVQLIDEYQSADPQRRAEIEEYFRRILADDPEALALMEEALGVEPVGTGTVLLR